MTLLTPRPEAHAAPDVARRPEWLSSLWAIVNPHSDLLSALSSQLYTYDMAQLPLRERALYVVNNPADARRVLVDEADRFPKAPAFATALRPLVGEGVFVSNGEAWRTRRAAIRPAFSHMALEAAFAQMAAAVDAAQARLDTQADCRQVIDLNAEMSHVTADVIHRTIFSRPISPENARLVFDSFARLQRSSDQLTLRALLFRRELQPKKAAAVAAAGAALRKVLEDALDDRLAAVDRGEPPPRDMLQSLLGSRDPSTGAALDREALVDEIAVFFLAGHETSASALTWALYMTSRLPGVAARIRDEHSAVASGDGSIAFVDAQSKLTYTRGVLRETFRLYPPVGFLVRTPTEPVAMRRWRLQPGDLVIVSPWLLGRHPKLWPSPNGFDPDRSAQGEPEPAAGSELAFGLGPRSCPGASFARLESALILARFTARYRLDLVSSRFPTPSAWLTVRPRKPILCRIARRAAA